MQCRLRTLALGIAALAASTVIAADHPIAGGTLQIKGGGASWPYAVTQPQTAVAVRFQIGGDLYCGSFATFTKNEPGRVQAKNASAPPDCTPPVCGDGIATGTEECDDGGIANGGGCSSTCQLENTSAICAGVPSTGGTAVHTIRFASGLEA